MFKKKGAPLRPTFVSFVDQKGGDDILSTPSMHDASDQSETASFSSPSNLDQNEDDMKLKLLPGELIVLQVPRVTRFLPFSDGSSGVFGSIVVTNFRVAFISLSFDSADDFIDKYRPRTHKFIRQDDIPLTNISEIYQVDRNKRKKLEKGSSLSDSMNKLEIYCRDFSVHAFSLLSRDGPSMKKLVSTIIQFVFPHQHELLFAYAYWRSFISQGHHPTSTFPFHDPLHWIAEMKACNATGFRVTSCNFSFTYAESLPQCFGVPESLTDDLIHKYKLSEANKSFPIWCYTHQNGSCLIRMASEHIPGTEAACVRHVINSISQRAPKFRVIDLTKEEGFPNLQELQDSYTSLRELCMPSSMKDVWSNDLTWLSSLENTRWLNHVSMFLSVAAKIVDLVVNSHRTVIIKEPRGNDFSPLISSLCQLLLNPRYRSITGFQKLIDKEWVALGHRFCERLGFITNKQKSPVFHAYLDCVWQLTQQFPADFEFTTVYLTSLYDCTFVGLFDSFLFNTPKQRVVQMRRMVEKPSILAKGRLNKSSPALQTTSDVLKLSPPSPSSSSSILNSHQFMTFWDWEVQFSSLDTYWFRNPLFYVFSPAASRNPAQNSSRISFGFNQNFVYADENYDVDSVRTSISQNCNSPVRTPSKKDFLDKIKNCAHHRTSYTGESNRQICNSVFYKESLPGEINSHDADCDLNAKFSSRSITSSSEMSIESSLRNLSINSFLSRIPDQQPVLCPQTCLPCLKLWDHCYLRWVTPLELPEGGSFAEYFAQIHIFQEIVYLQKNITKLEHQLKTDSICSNEQENEYQPPSTPNKLSTAEDSTFFVTNFQDETRDHTLKPSIQSPSDLFLQNSPDDHLSFPVPPDRFTSSFPYALQRHPTTFTTPMTFSSDGQRASYIDSDLASMDEMSLSLISTC